LTLNNRVASSGQAGTPSSGSAAQVPGSAMADTFIVFFATWTIVNQAALLGSVSFANGWSTAWVIGIVAAGLWLGKYRTDYGDHAMAKSWILAGSMLGAVLALCLHRPDADDEFYLGIAVMALDDPTRAIGALPALSRFPTGYVLSSYDLIRASITWISGIPLLTSYYLVWPAFLAILAVIAHLRLMAQAGVRNLGIAVALFFVLMLVWGDAHRTPANFAFVRLFQGKGGLISVAIPAAIHYWLRYLEFGQARYFALLSCAIVSAAGFSPSGIPTGVLLIALFTVATLLADWQSTVNRFAAMKLATIGLYPVGLGLWIKFKAHVASPSAGSATFGAGGEVSSALPLQTFSEAWSISNFQMIEQVVGSGFRGALALFCVLFLPVFLHTSAVRRPIAIYAFACSVLLTLPFSSSLFGAFAYPTFSWRWLYVVPFALAIVVAADCFLSAVEKVGHKWLLAGAGAILFLAASPRWVLSERNKSELRIPGFKLENPDGITLRPYEKFARRDGWWLISPVTGKPH
jgi:hypothetical protein